MRIIRYKKLHQQKTDESEISNDIEMWINNTKKFLKNSIDSKSCLVQKSNMLAKEGFQMLISVHDHICRSTRENWAPDSIRNPIVEY